MERVVYGVESDFISLAFSYNSLSLFNSLSVETSSGLLSLLIENHLTNFSLILAASFSISFGLFLKNLSIKIGTEIKKEHYLHDKLNLTKMEFIMRLAVRFAAPRIEANTIKVAENMDYV